MSVAPACNATRIALWNQLVAAGNPNGVKLSTPGTTCEFLENELASLEPVNWASDEDLEENLDIVFEEYDDAFEYTRREEHYRNSNLDLASLQREVDIAREAHFVSIAALFAQRKRIAEQGRDIEKEEFEVAEKERKWKLRQSFNNRRLQSFIDMEDWDGCSPSKPRTEEEATYFLACEAYEDAEDHIAERQRVIEGNNRRDAEAAAARSAQNAPKPRVPDDESYSDSDPEDLGLDWEAGDGEWNEIRRRTEENRADNQAEELLIYHELMDAVREPEKS